MQRNNLESIQEDVDNETSQNTKNEINEKVTYEVVKKRVKRV